jgi:ribonuclease HII
MIAVPRPTTKEERALRQRGFACVAGVDEAGCGCWAGPVFAAAVILRPRMRIGTIRDCKTLSAAQRERLVARIKSSAVAWAVASASVEEIDELNIRQAAGLAMRRAVEGLEPQPDFVLSDHFRVPDLTVPQEGITRGDLRVLSIAAASVIAKVERDAVMLQLAAEYPEYGFANHKGYGTKEHQEALQRLGPCPVHRRSYQPVRQTKLC